MELLDTANTSAYGHPVPTPVRVEPVKGKAILVSGHDLKDLEKLLMQTEGKGINIYTHGEMLPAHGYPGLKKFKHLAGNYGGAWQDQKENSRASRRHSYDHQLHSGAAGRLQTPHFHRGLVGWPGMTHIANGDFSPVIEAALAAPGFAEDGPDKTILVGFGHKPSSASRTSCRRRESRRHQTFLPGGRLRRRAGGRDYYTEFAESCRMTVSS